MSEYPSALTNLSEFKELTIKDISKVDDYLFVEFDCGQKLLMDQERVYEVSDYDSLSEVFLLNGRLCAALWKKHTLCAVDLDSKEVLLEDEKAIVTDISGTTRDIVEGTIQYKGINLNFIDTAGIRETEDIVEKIGVEKSKKIQESSDITILVLNNNELLTEEDKELLKKVEQEKGVIFINKIDLTSKLPELKTTKKIIKGSTIKNVGLEELKEEILSEFSLEDMSYKDLTYLFNTRQISLAKQALQNINHVIEENKKDIPVDMLAIEIRESWEYLGQIIGEAYEDELVDNIFKRFCLGK